MKKSTNNTEDIVFTSGDIMRRGPRFGDIYDIEIVDIDSRGQGVGFLKVKVGPQQDEKKYTFAVRNGVPGDHAHIRVTNPHRKKREARLQKLIRPSLMRTTPECPHADPLAERACGGCSLQSVHYEKQLVLKVDFLKRLFQTRGLDTDIISAMIGMEYPRYFRNKMEVNFGESKQFEIGLGMHPPRYHYEVIDHETCLIGPKPLIEFIEKIREWAILEKLEVANREEGTLQAVGLRVGVDAVAIELIVSHTLTTEQVNSFIKCVSALFSNPSISITVLKAKRGTPTLRESQHIQGPEKWKETIVVRDHSFTFEVTPGAFFQTNSIQTGVMYEAILDNLEHLIEQNENALIWDLYCGSGTISCVLGFYFKKVIGIDIIPESIQDAKQNAKTNGAKGCDFLCADADEIFKSGPVPDIIVVDPPRAGLSPKVITSICDSTIKGFVYVSCNPKTLVRDLALLKEGGFIIDGVQPIDMFPHTFHMENVVRLKR